MIALGMSYAPDVDPLALTARPKGADFGLCAGARLSRRGQEGAEGAGPLAGASSAPGTELKVFVDTAPVMEKPLGEAAGIGWQGKHTNLVSREHGSWLFLGAIYTTLELAPDAPHDDRCGSCRACQDACPTDAFPEPYRLDARRCISYLTIEHKGPIPEEFREAIGNRIYGCDDCLAVCPWNKFADAAAAPREAFVPREDLVAPDLAELLALDDAAFRREVLRLADQADRARPLRAQLPDRGGQQRRCGAAAAGRGAGCAIPIRWWPKRRAGRWRGLQHFLERHLGIEQQLGIDHALAPSTSLRPCT